MVKKKNLLKFVKRDIMNEEIEKQCPYCGHIFPFAFRICPYCGKKI
jgi:uncharacterized Zn-finger protein